MKNIYHFFGSQYLSKTIKQRYIWILWFKALSSICMGTMEYVRAWIMCKSHAKWLRLESPIYKSQLSKQKSGSKIQTNKAGYFE